MTFRPLTHQKMILVAKPSKPFEFTAKGTLRRNAILKAYEQEIEDLYKTVDDASQTNIVIPQLWTQKNVMIMIRDIVTTFVQRKLDDTDDIFVAGGDRYANGLLRFDVNVLTYRIF